MKTALLILFGLGIAGAVAVQVFARMTPSDPEALHVEPRMPEDGAGDWPLPNGHRAARLTGESPEAALARFDAIATATPRTRQIAGSPESGRITYLTRTRFWGFPDVTSVAAAPAGDQTRVTAYGRAVIGGYDWGVNRARLASWFEDFDGS